MYSVFAIAVLAVAMCVVTTANAQTIQYADTEDFMHDLIRSWVMEHDASIYDIAPEYNHTKYGLADVTVVWQTCRGESYGRLYQHNDTIWMCYEMVEGASSYSVSRNFGNATEGFIVDVMRYVYLHEIGHHIVFMAEEEGMPPHSDSDNELLADTYAMLVLDGDERPMWNLLNFRWHFYSYQPDDGVYRDSDTLMDCGIMRYVFESMPYDECGVLLGSLIIWGSIDRWGQMS